MCIAGFDAQGIERLIARVAALALLLATAGCSRSVAEDSEVGHWANVNGHRLYYEVRGEGPPIVLLHAGGDSIANTFGAQLAPFSAHHRIIAPEQVGHGRTPDIDAPLSYSAMMRDAATLLDQLHVTNAGVVGLSDGAILSLMLAVHRPDLVHRVVASGANIDPSGLVPDLVGLLHGNPAQIAQVVGNGPLGAKLRELWLHSPTPEELSPALLNKIQQPVMVMAGDQDLIVGEHTLLIYRSLPHGLLWILPATGHHTFSQRPDWVNSAILGFLDEK